jgi:hypothetical protein
VTEKQQAIAATCFNFSGASDSLKMLRARIVRMISVNDLQACTEEPEPSTERPAELVITPTVHAIRRVDSSGENLVTSRSAIHETDANSSKSSLESLKSGNIKLNESPLTKPMTNRAKIVTNAVTGQIADAANAGIDFLSSVVKEVATDPDAITLQLLDGSIVDLKEFHAKQEVDTSFFLRSINKRLQELKKLQEHEVAVLLCYNGEMVGLSQERLELQSQYRVFTSFQLKDVWEAYPKYAGPSHQAEYCMSESGYGTEPLVLWDIIRKKNKKIAEYETAQVTLRTKEEDLLKREKDVLKKEEDLRKKDEDALLKKEEALLKKEKDHKEDLRKKEEDHKEALLKKDEELAEYKARLQELMIKIIDARNDPKIRQQEARE